MDREHSGRFLHSTSEKLAEWQMCNHLEVHQKVFVNLKQKLQCAVNFEVQIFPLQQPARFVKLGWQIVLSEPKAFCMSVAGVGLRAGAPLKMQLTGHFIHEALNDGEKWGCPWRAHGWMWFKNKKVLHKFDLRRQQRL